MDSDERTGRERPLFHTFETLRPQIEDSSQEVWDRGRRPARAGARLARQPRPLPQDRLPGRRRPHLRRAGRAVEGQDEEQLRSRARRADPQRPQSSQQPTSAISPTRATKSPPVLLLMNVETVRRMQHSSERYSFSAHASGSWSLEHIHAQNAERLNRAEQWAEWLRLHSDALEGLPDLEAAERDGLVRANRQGAGRHLGGQLPPTRARADGALHAQPATPTTTRSTRSRTSRFSAAATTARSATPCSRSSAARSCAATARAPTSRSARATCS